MKRFTITLSSILAISGAAFYYIAIPHERIPQVFRFALYTAILGIIFAMALYHIYLYAFTSKEKAYLIYSVFTLLITIRFATAPGGLVETVASAHNAAIYHFSEVTLAVFNIFGIWFSHETLRIKWGGPVTRLIYIATVGLAVVMAVITGRVVGTWWYMLSGTPHIFIIAKGFHSKYCRSNPDAILLICVECIFFILAFTMTTAFMRALYMPVVPFWLMLVQVQAVLLSQGYGEAKRNEKELAEQKSLLESLNRTKSEFFGNISHEMKTPLTIVTTNMELAEQYIDDGNIDEAKELVRETCREAMQMANLVTDSLAFARRQETSRQMEYFDFGTVIETTLSAFKPLVNKHGNRFETNLAKLPPIFGNANELSDVLVNLLSNANRYTEGGVINIRWAMENEKLCLTVRDNGSGIPPDVLPRVFERGVTDGTGTGLGLAIVKSVMELHSGGVSVDSNPGKGTEVKLLFPITEEGV